MRNIFCTPAIKETLPALLQVKLLCSSFADTFLTVNSAETAKRLFCAYTKELFCRFLLFLPGNQHVIKLPSAATGLPERRKLFNN